MALLSLVALAGCGGGGGSPAAAAAGGGSSASTTATGGTSGVPAEMQAYVDCLKKNGVDLPAGGFGGGNGAPPGGAPGANGQSAAGETPPGSFQLGGNRRPRPAAAMHERGNGNGGAPPSFDREKFQAAQQACADLLPEGATLRKSASRVAAPAAVGID